MMTLINWLRAFFTQHPPAPFRRQLPLRRRSIPVPFQQADSSELVAASLLPSPAVVPLPAWLADEESLRDEGVLFGLSNAQPDTKIAQISAFFASQAIPLTELAAQYTGQIQTLTTRIAQRENQLTSLRDQLALLRDSQPVRTTLIGSSLVWGYPSPCASVRTTWSTTHSIVLSQTTGYRWAFFWRVCSTWLGEPPSFMRRIPG